jgi:hypothetical protein
LCTYLCMYVWIYVCIDVYMYVRIYVCMYVCMFACVYAYMDKGMMYLCMYVCMYACMYVCMYVGVFAYMVCMLYAHQTQVIQRARFTTVRAKNERVKPFSFTNLSKHGSTSKRSVLLSTKLFSMVFYSFAW